MRWWWVGQTAEFNCRVNEYVDYCPDYLYLLGLAYELSGDEVNAVATYLQLWVEYPDSPYTIMARAKLEPADGG